MLDCGDNHNDQQGQNNPISNGSNNQDNQKNTNEKGDSINTTFAESLGEFFGDLPKEIWNKLLTALSVSSAIYVVCIVFSNLLGHEGFAQAAFPFLIYFTILIYSLFLLVQWHRYWSVFLKQRKRNDELKG